MAPTAIDAQERLYQLSTAAYPLHADSALRPMTPAETEAMEAYLSRRLDLPAPPTFLSCTATAFKRAAMVVFHQEHVEATLIAEVPANARLGRHVPRQSILHELVAGNTPDEAGKVRMKRFIKDVQRIIFDGEHTLSVVFMSHRTVAQWDGAVLRLRGQSLRLHLLGAHVPGLARLRFWPAITLSGLLGRMGSTQFNRSNYSKTSPKFPYWM
ncbi:hypothetical protein PF005_g8897 [Phytophthora fragariae]|uniref:Uncharacterized protein n=1 Tax=Phytophthora fragariae TaxID=53985 RepID=A0A6A3F2W7_9STRA|nr:hypothetical protein PF003_g3002 [Phytophthora fragariae]KAE8940065.1 hypothetical protein PF009_g10113 [Phytophthora fragariae]KAE8989240.1 hypothetical protein PF011_g18851 [Phytophthora fragariae]KAE9087639.1 hypothetical protein PF007_g20293 [Phytophthora fragariae]KAE9118794.1 hypothetical protein PF010_g8094 [Phytophthora fragariae]